MVKTKMYRDEPQVSSVTDVFITVLTSTVRYQSTYRAVASMRQTEALASCHSFFFFFFFLSRISSKHYKQINKRTN